MTLLDKSKLKRILTQANLMDQVVSITGMLEEAQAIWDAAQTEQREVDARICDGHCEVPCNSVEVIRSSK